MTHRVFGAWHDWDTARSDPRPLTSEEFRKYIKNRYTVLE